MEAAEKYATVVQAFSADPAIRTSKMFGSPGLMVGGKVFALLWKERQLVVKLPAVRVTALVAAGEGEQFDPGMGRLMKEWLATESGAAGEWLVLAEEARDFVATGAGK